MLFDPKPDKLLSRTLYRTRVAPHVIFKVREEDAMNDAPFSPLSNYRESKLTGISNKTLYSQNELSSPIATNFCLTIIFGLDFNFYVIFLLIGIGQLDNDV